MQKLKPLAIKEFGMVSSLGVGAELNASAMRCGYDGFESADTIYPDKTGLIIAKSPIDIEVRGDNRLKALSKLAVEDLALSIEEELTVDLYVCIPTFLQHGVNASSDALKAILEGVSLATNKLKIENKKGFSGGATSLGVALEQIQESIYNKGNPALIVMVDSLISTISIREYMSREINRLLTPSNSNGFIPGEAAVALLVTKPDETTTTHITSIGYAEEEVTLESEEVFRAKGLTQATFNALKPLNIYADDTDFRISSVSGEHYFFTELTLTHGKTMKKARTEHPLWHPADSTGEVGSAMGGAMLVMAHYAFQKEYAPGDKALYHLSNESIERFTFVLEYTKGDKLYVK